MIIVIFHLLVVVDAKFIVISMRCCVGDVIIFITVSVSVNVFVIVSVNVIFNFIIPLLY